MDGFVVVDKPAGITSFDVVRQARRKLDFQKIGHLGTLDPQATGVMVLAINQATKLVEYLMKADKEYIGTITLGATSNTFDCEGEITQTDAEPVTEDQIRLVMKGFMGKISQIPPKYSAVKINGQRACDIVRRGGDVKLKAKTVTIHELEILEYKWPLLKVRVNCGSGTYVRSIANDMGEKLGCGAYLSDLQRTLVGRFAIEGAASLDNLSRDDMRPIDELVADWPRWDLPEFVYSRLRSGLSIAAPGNLAKYELIAAYFDGEFKGVLQWMKGATILKFKKQIV